MKLKLTLGRADGSTQDMVVTSDASASVGEIAQTIRRLDPTGDPHVQGGDAPTLRVSEYDGSTAVLSPGTPIAEATVASGSGVSIVPAASTGRSDGTVLAVLRIIDGPGTGREIQLRAGGAVLGRSQNAEIQLDDPLVSKFHARLEVGRTVDLVDLNSANGLVIDGQQLSRVSLETGQTVVIGGTTLRAEVLTASQPEADRGRVRGPVAFLRSPVVEARYPGEEYEGPEIPKKLDSQPFPWVIIVAPLLMGAVLYAIFQNAMTIAFIALSPVLMIGAWLTQVLANRRKMRDQIDRFEEQLAFLGETLEAERAIERDIRLREAPSTAEVLEETARLGAMLWSRRPEHWSFLNLRLGIGTADSRNRVKGVNSRAGIRSFIERFTALAEHYRRLDGVPLVENLVDAGAIGVAGERFERNQVANALLVQVAGLYSPAEVSLAAIAGPTSAPSFEWLKWLPHVASSESPLPAVALADSAGSSAVVLAQLEDLVEQRLARKQGRADQNRGPVSLEDAAMHRGSEVGDDEDDELPPLPTLVVLIADDAPLDRGRLIRLSERAADAGVVPVWLAEEVTGLPASCRTYVELVPGTSTARVVYVRTGSGYDQVQIERVAADTATAFARHLSAVSDISVVASDATDIPRSVSLVGLLGQEMKDSSDAIIDRWRQNDSIHDRTPGAAHVKRRTSGKLRALVGQSSLDAMHLDLRTQGPHALVGGTTGSGKSEFLQAWVLGMAAEYSPDRVTFLFVDYKGGSAFADCVELPHCVGLVTDLSPHLVRRALTSLRAELHHREHLFNRKKVKDLLELERSGDPESPPALVLVIDEFAALVGEVPEFVDGVVDIAQRGRSLGIHLIMATQRPAGVIRDNLRANTNLRVALRMADEADSSDVIGTPEAAGFDPSIPGRAVAKTGPGRLEAFQTGYAGGWTTDEPQRAAIAISDLAFGPGTVWEEPEEQRREEAPPSGPNDTASLVAKMIAAAGVAEIPPPRKPWLDDLGRAYDLAKLRQRSDDQLVLGVTDDPSRQSQYAVYFRPDVDGNLVVYGTGGSGKSTLLRTLGVAAGITPRGGPVHVYGIDFSAGGLRLLETLPHVGAIIQGDDLERIQRLLVTLRGIVDERIQRYSEARASTIAEYRAISGRSEEPRILLLIDGMATFRQDYEYTGAGGVFALFQQLIADGRPVGVHVAVSADRPGSIAPAVAASLQKRVSLRLTDENDYAIIEVPRDVLDASSPPGRAVIDGLATQIAVFGGSDNVAQQAHAVEQLAAAIRAQGRSSAPGVARLAEEIPLDAIVGALPGRLVLGVADDDLQPVGIEPEGVLLVSGPPASGRSTAVEMLARNSAAALPSSERYYFGNAKSSIGSLGLWHGAATTIDAAAALARELLPKASAPAAEGRRLVIVVEAVSDFLSSAADPELVQLIKAARRNDHLVIAESETSTLSQSWPLLVEIKSARRGFALQPDPMEGEMLFRTTFPRAKRSDFPQGRGYLVQGGKVRKVQLALPTG